MAHEHGAPRDLRALALVLGISSGVFLLELAGGLLANSLALLADAAHVFADMSGVALALFALWFARRPGGETRTYGFYRVEILAAVANALLLFALAAYILFEAWTRLGSTPEIATTPMLAVAVVGLIANLSSAFLLRNAQRESLNMRGAFLEVLSDAAGAGAVILAAGVILLTGFRTADAIASAIIGLLILPRTWRLLRDALDVLLEAAPHGVDMNLVREHILQTPGVSDVHDLHAWTITSGMNVVSAHVVLGPDGVPGDVLDHLGMCLSDDFDINHSTFQLETPEHVIWEARSAQAQH